MSSDGVPSGATVVCVAPEELPTPAVENLTFSSQSQKWLADLAARRRNPVAPTTIRTFSASIRKLTPMIGDAKLADIGNGFLKALVTKLCEQNLSAKTIAELVSTIKQVMRSAVDADGNQLFPRAWNSSFIDLPALTNQKQHCATSADVDRITARKRSINS